MDKIKRLARAVFTRKVRASLYGLGIAGVAALVASHDLPPWASPLAAPFLLALLNLSPKDVENDYGDPKKSRVAELDWTYGAPPTRRKS